VTQAPKLERRITQSELSNDEWDAINPMFPNKPLAERMIKFTEKASSTFAAIRGKRDLPG
jgi:hypothetical protein